MRRYVAYFLRVGILAVAMLLFYLAAVAWGKMALGHTMFYLKEPLTIQEALAEAKQQKEADEDKVDDAAGTGTETFLDFCIWGQKERVTLKNETLFRSIQADAILLCGNPELLFAGCRFPLPEDEGGCVIDEQAAWELFGGVDAVGGEVSYEGNAYTVRQVIPGREKTVAFQLSEGNGEDGQQKILDRMNVRKSRNSSVTELERTIASQFGFAVTILDLELLHGIAGGCVLLIPCSVCMCFFCYFAGQYKRQEKITRKAVMAGTILAMAVFFMFLLKRWVNIPDDYIPARWSEFQFWRTLWEDKANALKFLLQMKKTGVDIGWMGSFYQAVCYGLLAEALFLSISCLKPRTH